MFNIQIAQRPSRRVTHSWQPPTARVVSYGSLHESKTAEISPAIQLLRPPYVVWYLTTTPHSVQVDSYPAYVNESTIPRRIAGSSSMVKTVRVVISGVLSAV